MLDKSTPTFPEMTAALIGPKNVLESMKSKKQKQKTNKNHKKEKIFLAFTYP